MADVEVFSFWFSRKAFKQARLCERKIWLLHCLQMRTMSHLSVLYIYIFFFYYEQNGEPCSPETSSGDTHPWFQKGFFSPFFKWKFCSQGETQNDMIYGRNWFFFFFHCYMMWLNVYFVKKKKNLSCFRMLLIVRIGKFSRQVWKKFLDD